jgi:hypothetical protein
MELRGEFEVHQIFDLGARMALFVDGHQLLQHKKSLGSMAWFAAHPCAMQGSCV